MMVLEVRLGQKGHWQVRNSGAVVAVNETQQYAIEIANAIARENHGEVIWYDREGNLQGGVNFRPFASRSA
jgi:hypothetical protein